MNDYGDTQSSSSTGSCAIELAARDAFDNLQLSSVIESSKEVSVGQAVYRVRVSKVVGVVEPLRVAGVAK